VSPLRLVYILAMLLVTVGSSVAVGVSYHLRRSRLAGASLALVCHHAALLTVDLAHKGYFLLYDHYNSTISAFLTVLLFSLIFLYPYYFGAVSGHQSTLTTGLLIVAATISIVSKIVFGSLVPNIVLVLAVLTAIAFGLIGPREDETGRHRYVRSLSLLLAIGAPFLLIDLLEESAVSFAENLVVSSLDFYPAVFATISLVVAARHVSLLSRSDDLSQSVRMPLGMVLWTKAGLSAREVQVAQRTAAGLSNGAIAAELFISESTVKKHLNSIFRKTGFESRHRLIAAAHEAMPTEEGVTTTARDQG
jgi:DNA-binding CsgD family transcriptional regulator